MATNTNNQTVGVKFTLKGKYDTGDTVTLWLTNKPVLGEKAAPQPHFPILASVRNLGVEQNEHFPKFTRGSVLIRNNRDSIAFEKRFTDLACNYVIQGAIVEVYVDCTDVKDSEFFTDAVLVWKGEIQGVRYSTDSRNTQRLSIDIGQEQREHVVTKKIRPLEFPTAPDRSLNKYLPLVLGFNQQVLPYPIQEQIVLINPLPGYQRYAYATNLESTISSSFHNIGVTGVVAKELRKDNIDAAYYPVTSGSTITPSYGWVANPTVGTVVNLSTPRAFWIPGFMPGIVPSTSHIVHGITLDLVGNGAGGDPSGELSIRIHRKRLGSQRPAPPSEAVAEAVIDKSEFPAWSGGAGFTVAAQFDRVVPIVGDSSDTYWISIQGSNEDDAASVTHLPVADIAFLTGVPTGLITHFNTPDTAAAADNDDTWEEELTYGTAGQSSPNFGLYGLEFGDTPQGDGVADEQGLSYSYIDMRFQTFSSILSRLDAQTIPKLDDLDFLLEITGLSDVDGTITGVPGFILGNPLTQVDALFHTYDGSNWLAGNFDDSRFTASHDQYTVVGDSLFRETAGRTFNKATNIEVIQELARCSYSKIAYDGVGASVGNYSILAVGRRRDPILTIDDNDLTLESWFVNGLDTVYNTIDMNYARRLDSVYFQESTDQEDFKDYSKTLYVHFRDGGVGQTYGAISAEHYGERRPANENFDWIFGDSSAASVAELFLRLHDHPYEYAQVTVPYCKYSSLKMYDVIKVNSTEIPSCWGTSPSVHENSECGPANQNFAKTASVKAEIVAMTLNLVQDAPLELRLLLRLVTQINDPLYNVLGQD